MSEKKRGKRKKKEGEVQFLKGLLASTTVDANGRLSTSTL
jgi:hypothetical protein